MSYYDLLKFFVFYNCFQKLQSQIQETEESTCKKQTEIQTLKESIKEVESEYIVLVCYGKRFWPFFGVLVAIALDRTEMMVKTAYLCNKLNTKIHK